MVYIMIWWDITKKASFECISYNWCALNIIIYHRLWWRHNLRLTKSNMKIGHLRQLIFYYIIDLINTPYVMFCMCWMIFISFVSTMLKNINFVCLVVLRCVWVELWVILFFCRSSKKATPSPCLQTLQLLRNGYIMKYVLHDNNHHS